jgi:lipopolysaccharide/colanic/teichoic acid biosynthesis glycosyltransferase
MSRYFYLPALFPLLSDLALLTVSILLTLSFAPMVSSDPFQKYQAINFLYTVYWIIFSFFTGRYKKLREQTYNAATQRLILTSLLTTLMVGFAFFTPFNTGYSIWVIISYTFLNFLLTTILYIFSFGVRNAVEYKEPDIKTDNDKTVTDSDKANLPLKLDPKSTKLITDSIIEYAGSEAYKYVSGYLNFGLTSTLTQFSFNFYELKSKSEDRYTAYAQFKMLNDIRGINKLFSLANQKLPVSGTIVCCFEQSSTRKKRILEKFPPVLNGIIYFFDYVFRRVLPKLNISNRAYYKITRGKDRVLSKTEVLGRLVYCGFDIVDVQYINHITWVVAQKIRKIPGILESKRYGPFIKLRRVGRNGKIIHVFKMRTMFPYSEYLQAYIYRQNKLQEGGKFKNDTRINYLGLVMRKYWIDELPMIINLIRGDMKLVGVRPLSQHYFNLYSLELQRKRIRFKPGLLPPYYADLPTTLEEIETSEMRYLLSCEKNGLFKTDFIYFFRILRNIVLRKARSA